MFRFKKKNFLEASLANILNQEVAKTVQYIYLKNNKYISCLVPFFA